MTAVRLGFEANHTQVNRVSGPLSMTAGCVCPTDTGMWPNEDRGRSPAFTSSPPQVSSQRRLAADGSRRHAPPTRRSSRASPHRSLRSLRPLWELARARPVHSPITNRNRFPACTVAEVVLSSSGRSAPAGSTNATVPVVQHRARYPLRARLCLCLRPPIPPSTMDPRWREAPGSCFVVGSVSRCAAHMPLLKPARRTCRSGCAPLRTD